MKKSRISFGGHSIVVHEFGADDFESRATAVAIHGFGVDAQRTFRHIDRAGRDARLRIVAPDLLGFGQSDKPDMQYGLRLYAELTKHVVDSLEIERPLLLGHSLGGKVALAAAIDHGDSFMGLVLVNSGGFSIYAPFLPTVAGRRWVVDLFRRPWFNRHVVPRTPLGGFLSAADAHEQLARFRTSHARLDLARSGYLSRIERLALPSVIIWGRDDPILPRGTPGRIRRYLPDAKLVYIDGAGHAPMKSDPQAFVDAVAGFRETLAG